MGNPGMGGGEVRGVHTDPSVGNPGKEEGGKEGHTEPLAWGEGENGGHTEFLAWGEGENGWAHRAPGMRGSGKWDAVNAGGRRSMLGGKRGDTVSGRRRRLGDQYGRRVWGPHRTPGMREQNGVPAIEGVRKVTHEEMEGCQEPWAVQ